MTEKNLSCPKCETPQISKNGKIHNGQQNSRCRYCGRQFIKNPTKKYITEETKQLIESLFTRKNISSWNSSRN